MRFAEGLARGRTRWRRFALAFVPASGLVVTALVLMAIGVLAIPITIAGGKFTVTASSLTSHNSVSPSFIQYATVDASAGPTPHAAAVTYFPDGADLKDLDQVVCGPAPFVGNIQIEIKASDANATGGLVVDVTKLTTDAAAVSTFTNIQIGVPAPAGIPDPAAVGSFAQTADGFTITGGNLTQTAIYTKAGSFALTGLGLTVTTPAVCP